MSDWDYVLPCLSRYSFDSDGVCTNIETGHMPAVLKLNKKPYAYRLWQDNDVWTTVRLVEIIQHIKHQKQVEQHNPLDIPKHIYYRPIIKYLVNRKRLKLK